MSLPMVQKYCVPSSTDTNRPARSLSLPSSANSPVAPMTVPFDSVVAERISGRELVV